MKLLFLIPAVLLAACSSTMQVSDNAGQYCYTDEKIVRSSGDTVSSQTVIQCSDRPKVNHVTRSAGVAEECRTYTTVIARNGVRKNVKGFLCRFPGGVWEPVNDVYAH